MKTFLWNIFLALAWAAMTDRFTPGNLMVGFLLGYALLRLGQASGKPSVYFTKMRRAVVFLLFFLYELVRANLRVARHVLQPLRTIQPAVIGIPLDARTPTEITLLANLISLTPGTLSLDVSSDRRVLYVHTIAAKDPERFREEIKSGLERRVLAVLR